MAGAIDFCLQHTQGVSPRWLADPFDHVLMTVVTSVGQLAKINSLVSSFSWQLTRAMLCVPSILCLFFFYSTLLAGANVARPPPELYSSLIPSKILVVAKNESNPPKYPQWTDRVSGIWQYFQPDTWTTGFFPTMLYALNTRAELCETGDDASWVNLGRQWSTGEILLETNNHVGHDVGFLSMPFQEEYHL